MVEELGQNEAPAAKAAAGAVNWEAVRRDYEANVLLLKEMAELYGVTVNQISYRARKEKWAPRYMQTLERENFAERMFLILGRQIIKLQARMRHAKMDDKDVILLNTMTRTWEKLIELDARTKGTKARKRTPQAEDMRKQLVQRITELARR